MRPTKYEKGIMEILGTSCRKCDFDEAEGVLIDHCDECCRRIVGLIWERTYLSKDAPFKS